jgi:alpha-tubulin suppressor-like RCC1 family protein
MPSALPREQVRLVAAGPRHSLAVTSNGKVIGWGDDRVSHLERLCELTGS